MHHRVQTGAVNIAIDYCRKKIKNIYDSIDSPKTLSQECALYSSVLLIISITLSKTHVCLSYKGRVLLKDTPSSRPSQSRPAADVN